jgi:hypothetical protein
MDKSTAIFSPTQPLGHNLSAGLRDPQSSPQT